MDLKYTNVDYKYIEAFLKKLNGVMADQEYPIDGWKIRTARYIKPKVYEYLDDWTDIKTGDSWVTDPDITAFFSTGITIPPALQNQNVYLNLNIGGEALVYVNGEPYHGLDKNRNLIKLDDKSRGKEHLDILVEAAVDRQAYEFQSRYWLNVQYKPHRFTTAKLVVMDETIWKYYFDMLVAKEYYKNLDEGELKNRYVEVIKESMMAVEFEAGRSRMLETIKAAESILGTGIDDITIKTSQITTNLLGHSHIDIAYLWPLKETIRKSSRTFSTALRLMDQYDGYTFIQSQAILYDYMKREYPSIYEGIKKKIEEGQWEVEGAMWVEPDCNLISGESFIRQILYGKQFFKEEFHKDCKILWLPDTFGFSWSLPQIMKGCGIDYFVTQKIKWNKTNTFPYNVFRWKGADGSEVLSLITGPYNGTLSGQEIAERYEGFTQKDKCNGYLELYGYGDGGGGVNLEMLETAQRLPKFNKNTDFKTTFALDYLKNITNMDQLPVWNDELYLEAHRGTYTSHAALKELNRKSERLFHDVEFFLSVIPSDKTSAYYQMLKESWKKVLTNQFHDILPGSVIKEAFLNGVETFQEALHSASDIKETLISSIIEGDISEPSNESTNFITVWNTLSWDRTDVVNIKLDKENRENLYEIMDEGGNKIPCQIIGTDSPFITFTAEVPSMGYRVYTIKQLDKSSSEVQCNNGGAEEKWKESKEWSVENPYFKLTFNAKGNIIHLWDKGNQREVIPEGREANVFQIFVDEPQQYDAWEVEEFNSNKWYEDFSLEHVEVIDEGPVMKKIRMNKQWNRSHITQDIILYNDVPRIDFETEVDWRENRKLLKTAFPVDVIAQEATYDIAYGTIKRAAHDNTSWDKAKFEVSAHMWADLSEHGYGVSLLNDSKYGYDIKSNTMRLSLLKASINPNPEADRGKHHFTYALYPHTGSWEEGNTVQQAYQLNTPLTVIGGGRPKLDASAKGFLKVDCDNVLIEAVKPSEDGSGIIIRLLEKYGKRANVTVTSALPLQQVYACNMIEELDGEIEMNQNTFQFEMLPYKINTFKLITIE